MKNIRGAGRSIWYYEVVGGEDKEGRYYQAGKCP